MLKGVKMLSKLNYPPSKNGPFFDHLRFDMKINNNEVVTILKVEEYHLNAKNTVHGGVIATMLDNVIGDSIAIAVNCSVVTINLNINYVAPVKVGSLLTATGKIIQQGYRISMAEGIIEDEKGNLIAKGIGTFKIIRK